MVDCIFCKIISKEVESNIIYEDDQTISFLDINPVNKGHSLVMPKNHYPTFMDIPKSELGAIFSTIQDVTSAVMKSMNASGSNLLMNNKKAAGQLVNHVHFHIIPRFKNDGLKHWPQGTYKEWESKEIAEKIKSFL